MLFRSIFYVISCLFMSFHVISCHFRSFHAILCHFISFHFISFHFISFHVISCHFMSYHIISFHVISCHIKCHRTFPHCHSIKLGGVRGWVKYVFLSLRRQLRCQAKGKDGSQSRFDQCCARLVLVWMAPN
jgi:hypothetical protein